MTLGLLFIRNHTFNFSHPDLKRYVHTCRVGVESTIVYSDFFIRNLIVRNLQNCSYYSFIPMNELRNYEFDFFCQIINQNFPHSVRVVIGKLNSFDLSLRVLKVQQSQSNFSLPICLTVLMNVFINFFNTWNWDLMPNHLFEIFAASSDCAKFPNPWFLFWFFLSLILFLSKYKVNFLQQGLSQILYTCREIFYWEAIFSVFCLEIRVAHRIWEGNLAFWPTLKIKLTFLSN